MTKTQATKIARHLTGEIYCVAASRMAGKTYGFNIAVGEKQYTTLSCGTYRSAVSARQTHMDDLIYALLNDEAGDWETLDFEW